MMMTPTLPAVHQSALMPHDRGNNDAIWTEAFEDLRSKLQPQDVRRIYAGSFQSLMKQVCEERHMYKDRTIPRLLDRLNPFLSRLRVFSSALDTYSQANRVLCLVWGTMKIMLELATRFKDVLENIVAMLENINNQLPRFEIYLEAFPEHKRVREAVMNLYILVVSFQIDCLLFLQKHPIRNLIRASWSTFDQVYKNSLSEIQKCCESIDVEAFAANVMSDRSRHEELKSLLLPRARPPKDNQYPCHIIHFPANPLFCGRELILEHLRDRLIRRRAEQNSIALAGLGGVGKTQVATIFTWANKDHFDVVLWVQADSMLKIEQGFVRLAQLLDLPHASGEANVSLVVDEALQWLRSTGTGRSWLLVFDNVDDGKILQSFWPVCQHGSILVTTRSIAASSTPASEICHVLPLSNEEGCDLVLKAMGNHTPTGLDTALALQLSEKLGGLPLALAQIAGFLSTINYTTQEFLDMYRESEKERDCILFTIDSGIFNYDYTLDTVWGMTLSRLQAGSMSLLRVLSFLDPDSIPESLLCEPAIFREDPELEYPNCLRRYLEALTQLRASDLIHRDATKKSLSVHRLVQASVRQRMSIPERMKAFQVVVKLLSALYPRQELGMAMDEFWDECEILLPQVLSVASHYGVLGVKASTRSQGKLVDLDEPLQESTHALIELLHNATWFMQERGMFEQLLPIVDIGKAILTSLGENESMMMGEFYNTLGNVYLEIGNPQKCKEYFVKVKNIREAHHPSHDPVIANITDNLSLAETALGNHNTAVELSKQVISIREGLSDAKYQKYKKNTLSTNRNNLCRILWLTGQLEEAAEIGERSIKLSREAFGLKSKNTAQAIFNLADVRLSQGHEDALKLHLQALYLRRTVLGSHYQTAGSCYKTACLLFEQGDAQHAKKLLRETLIIYRSSFAAEGGRARALFKLSKVLEALGESDAAINTLSEAIVLLKELQETHQQELGLETRFDLLVPYVDR